jgi:lauroyl/myristoyl acyltransferase
MNLSNYLFSSDFFSSSDNKSSTQVRAYIFTKGNEWFKSFPEQTMLITRNLRTLGISYDNSLIKNIQTHILLHYYEKILPLIMSAEEYYKFIKENVKILEGFEDLKDCLSQKKGIILALCHFGAVELIGPTLCALGIPLTVALRFSNQKMAEIAKIRFNELSQSGLFAPMKIIEIGKTSSPVALEMAASLRRHENLLTVFDEKTNYSIPVNFFKNKIYGGAGINKLINLSQTDPFVFACFCLRKDDDTYEIIFKRISSKNENMIQEIYNIFEGYIIKNCNQWYFLHEEIPFVK